MTNKTANTEDVLREFMTVRGEIVWLSDEDFEKIYRQKDAENLLEDAKHHMFSIIQDRIWEEFGYENGTEDHDEVYKPINMSRNELAGVFGGTLVSRFELGYSSDVSEYEQWTDLAESLIDQVIACNERLLAGNRTEEEAHRLLLDRGSELCEKYAVVCSEYERVLFSKYQQEICSGITLTTADFKPKTDAEFWDETIEQVLQGV
jgi:hypothetical protein